MIYSFTFSSQQQQHFKLLCFSLSPLSGLACLYIERWIENTVRRKTELNLLNNESSGSGISIAKSWNGNKKLLRDSFCWLLSVYMKLTQATPTALLNAVTTQFSAVDGASNEQGERRKRNEARKRSELKSRKRRRMYACSREKKRRRRQRRELLIKCPITFAMNKIYFSTHWAAAPGSIIIWIKML